MPELPRLTIEDINRLEEKGCLEPWIAARMRANTLSGRRLRYTPGSHDQQGDYLYAMSDQMNSFSHTKSTQYR